MHNSAKTGPHQLLFITIFVCMYIIVVIKRVNGNYIAFDYAVVYLFLVDPMIDSICDENNNFIPNFIANMVIFLQ